MSSRFEIKDSVGNTMTLQLTENWLDYNGRWMPDTPGKVMASTDWNRNPYDALDVLDRHPYHAYLYTFDSIGRRLHVLTLAYIVGSVLYEDAGSGSLSPWEALTLRGGNITWRKL